MSKFQALVLAIAILPLYAYAKDTACCKPDAIKSEDIGKLEALARQQGETLFLPEGYSIDLKSCNSKAVGILNDAIQFVKTKNLSCLRSFNPKLAIRLNDSIKQKKLRIRCFGYKSQLKAEELCPGASKDCSTNIRNAQKANVAFFLPRFPNDIFLTKHDPQSSATSVIMSAQVVADTIFHETIHASGYTQESGKLLNREHTTRPANFGDPVFGYSALCSSEEPAKSQITLEGCEACLKSENNKPSPSQLQKCKRYPRAEAVRALRAVQILSDQLTTCEKRKMNCSDEEIINYASSVCSSTGLTLLDARCYNSTRAALAQALIGVAKDGKKDPNSKMAFDFFTSGDLTQFNKIAIHGFCGELRNLAKENLTLAFNKVVKLRETYDAERFFKLDPAIPRGKPEAVKSSQQKEAYLKNIRNFCEKFPTRYLEEENQKFKGEAS